MCQVLNRAKPLRFHEFSTILFFSDTYIQKAKKTYQDSRSRRNLNTLNTELHDVQRIMVQNIDDVLQRGAVLSGKKFQSSPNCNTNIPKLTHLPNLFSIFLCSLHLTYSKQFKYYSKTHLIAIFQTSPPLTQFPWINVQNIDFTELDTKAQNLKHHSSKYKKDAALLNATSWMAIGAGGTILFLVFFIWYKFLLWTAFENNIVI